jgi:hypothetical protein
MGFIFLDISKAFLLALSIRTLVTEIPSISRELPLGA